MKNKLLTFSKELGFKDLESRLEKISGIVSNGNADLIIPLVGEFSAGKTTLINALTDSKALECATKPTTATIYTIHFGSEHEKAIVHYQDGTTKEFDDISLLKNDDLGETLVVDVFDTSDKVPNSIILVDTPGLSSQDIKHKQTLVNFLPEADAIILVSDINQQITKSLTNFSKTIALSKRPIYLVFTQCDTKSSEDVDKAKEYLLKNTELPLQRIISISAKNEEMEELYSLLKEIQKEKTSILETVNEYRCKEIAHEMVSRINILLDSSKSDEEIDESIREQQLKLNKIKRQINDIAESINSEIEEIQRKISRQFEDRIFERLDSIVSGNSSNYDAEAISSINNLSSILLNEYKSEIVNLFGSKTKEIIGEKGLINLETLQSLDISQHSINGLSYNLNLNEAGHEFDKKIATGLKVAAVAAAVVVTAGAASAAAGGTAVVGEAGAVAAAEGGAGLTGAQGALIAADVADTVTDIGSIVANRRYADKINKVVQYGGKMNENMEKINNFDSSAGQKIGQNRGIVESLVGFVTEKTMGKPQRRRMIHNYIDTSLAPVFNDELKRITHEISNDVVECLDHDVEIQTNEISRSLEELKEARQNKHDEFENKIKSLKSIKKELEIYEHCN